MTNTQRVVERLLARLRSLVPHGENLREFASQMLDQQIASVTPNTSMGVVPLPIPSQTQMLASARMAAELIDTPERLAAKPEGIVDIGVIEWLLRPALPLRHHMFEPIQSGIWRDLPSDVVAAQSTAVCRLDVTVDASDPVQVGTGFVAGEDDAGRSVIVTNAHVVDEVVRIGWPANERIVFACDFERFSIDSGGELRPLETEYQLHPSYDMALLCLRRDLANPVDGIKPLPIAADAPERIVELRIGVVGHPAFDSRHDPFPQFYGFGNEFGVKRFSPGFVRAITDRAWHGGDVRVLLHDATTLSGSSGSCILDLDTLKVVGLHFGGWPLTRRRVRMHTGDVVAELFESNGAVPMWKLVQDPFCSNLAFR